LAYTIVVSERRGRTWSPVTTIGIFLALFGLIRLALDGTWSWLSPKLTDTIPSETDLLLGGLVILAVLVVLALDLLGKVDVMTKVRQGVDRVDPSRGPAGD
jgi:hypothetical protein